MPKRAFNEETGQMWVQGDNGQWLPDTEPGNMIAAGAKGAAQQMGNYWRGVQNLIPGIDERRLQLEQLKSEQALEPTRVKYPAAVAVGKALPGMATALITGGESVPAQIALQGAIGAGEHLIDYDANDDSQLDNAARGFFEGVAGDIGGRMAGRVFKGLKGLIDDFRLKGARDIPLNPAAAEFERLGGQTLPSQRLAPDDPRILQMQRIEQGAESSAFPPAIFRDMDQANRQLANKTAINAIGAGQLGIDDLSPAALGRASDALSDKFTNLTMQAGDIGGVPIAQDLADRIATTKGQIPELMKRGRFPGLEHGMMTGNEYSVARRALVQDAADRAAKGQHELADEIFADVEQLDHVFGSRMPPEVLDEWAKTREQYRVLQILQKPGVIRDGEISIKSLNNAINSKSGFGKTAREARGTTNAETQQLIDLARVGSDRSLQRMQSSGTSERLSMRNVIGDLFGGNILGSAANMAYPAAFGVSAAGAGRAITGALSPSGPVPGRIGAAAVRGTLDDLLYPYVGQTYEGDRPQ